MGKLKPILLLMLLASCSLFQNDAVDRYAAKVWEASAATWAADAHVYATNEILFCSDCPTIKRGDGVHRYSQLPSLGGDSLQLAGKLATKVNKAGDNMLGNLGVQTAGANKFLVAMNLGGSSSAGNSTLGPSSYYLGLGHREWGVGTLRLVGFGFRYTTNDYYPVSIGYQESSGSSSTSGRFGIWTRPVNTNTAPLLRMSVEAAGNIKNYGPVTAPEDVATKGYVDTVYKQTKTITFTGTYSLNGTPSNTFVCNNASAANTITLPTAKDGITYTIWKIGGSVMTLTGAIVDAGKSGTKVVSGTESGSAITVVCRGNSWIITAKNGTWTTQ
jgi:hypothetical protein